MKELINIQSELKAPKSNYNSFGKYHYRSAEDILEAVKPLLKANGCFLTVSDEVVEIGGRVYIKATAKIQQEQDTLKGADGGTEGILCIKASISATGYAREAESKKGCDPAQLTGLTSSYARKYALAGLFALDDTKDSDAFPPVRIEEKVTKAAPGDWKRSLQSCKTKDELQKVWLKIQQAKLSTDPELKNLKDELKVKL